MSDLLEQTMPGWRRDPSGRYEWRWWDGNGWTNRVANSAPRRTPPARTPRRDAPAPPAASRVARRRGADGPAARHGAPSRRARRRPVRRAAGPPTRRRCPIRRPHRPARRHRRPAAARARPCGPTRRRTTAHRAASGTAPTCPRPRRGDRASGARRGPVGRAAAAVAGLLPQLLGAGGVVSLAERRGGGPASPEAARAGTAPELRARRPCDARGDRGGRRRLPAVDHVPDRRHHPPPNGRRARGRGRLRPRGGGVLDRRAARRAPSRHGVGHDGHVGRRRRDGGDPTARRARPGDRSSIRDRR